MQYVGKWQSFVVVVEFGKQGWTIGPFHSRFKAESVQGELPSVEGLSSWVEPVLKPKQAMLEIKQAHEDGMTQGGMFTS